jgi:hypothetical protein
MNCFWRTVILNQFFLICADGLLNLLMSFLEKIYFNVLLASFQLQTYSDKKYISDPQLDNFENGARKPPVFLKLHQGPSVTNYFDAFSLQPKRNGQWRKSTNSREENF